jgi:hypothetical protein
MYFQYNFTSLFQHQSQAPAQYSDSIAWVFNGLKKISLFSPLRASGGGRKKIAKRKQSTGNFQFAGN